MKTFFKKQNITNQDVYIISIGFLFLLYFLLLLNPGMKRYYSYYVSVAFNASPSDFDFVSIQSKTVAFVYIYY